MTLNNQCRLYAEDFQWNEANITTELEMEIARRDYIPGWTLDNDFQNGWTLEYDDFLDPMNYSQYPYNDGDCIVETLS